MILQTQTNGFAFKRQHAGNAFLPVVHRLACQAHYPLYYLFSRVLSLLHHGAPGPALKIQLSPPSLSGVVSDVAKKTLMKLILCALKIQQLIERKGVTQSEIAPLLGLDQPKVSNLMRGRLTGFSVERLFDILNRLGHNIEIHISEEEYAPDGTHTVVA